MQETGSELSRLLQQERELRVREQLRATEREKALRQERESMRQTIIDQSVLKIEALERERDSLLEEVHLKTNNSTVSDIADEVMAERAEKESVIKRRDEPQEQLEQVQLQLHREKDLREEKRLRDSEREKVLRQQISKLREQLRRERHECTASFVPKLKALQRENTAVITQVQQLQMSSGDKQLTLRDLSKKDGAESEERVPEIHHDVSANDSEETKVLGQETLVNLVEKIQTKVLDTLEALDRHVNVFNNDLGQVSFECVAEIYRERTDVEMADVVEDLNIRLQEEMELTKELQLKDSEREKEKEVYLKQIEDLTLVCEGKALRVDELREKLKEVKGHAEAVKDEQFKRIQALNTKNRQLLETNAQQKLRENVLSLRVQELEQELEQEMSPLTATSDLTGEDAQPESSGEEKKKKRRKGWKKLAHYTKPWNWVQR